MNLWPTLIFRKKLILKYSLQHLFWTTLEISNIFLSSNLNVTWFLLRIISSMMIKCNQWKVSRMLIWFLRYNSLFPRYWTYLRSFWLVMVIWISNSWGNDYIFIRILRFYLIVKNKVYATLNYCYHHILTSDKALRI